MIDQSNRAGKFHLYNYVGINPDHYFLKTSDIGGGIGGPAGYNPDGSMRYMMDGGQQFTPPGKVNTDYCEFPFHSLLVCKSSICDMSHTTKEGQCIDRYCFETDGAEESERLGEQSVKRQGNIRSIFT